MELVKYGKGYAVFGDTIKHKDKLKEYGAKYNPNLTHPDTEEKAVGWIVSKSGLERVQALVDKHPMKAAKKTAKTSKKPKDESEEESSKSEEPKSKKTAKASKKPKDEEPVSEVEDEDDEELKLYDYTDASYALFGNPNSKTKEKLKEWKLYSNANLTNPDTQKKENGWVLPKKNRNAEKVKELVGGKVIFSSSSSYAFRLEKISEITHFELMNFLRDEEIPREESEAEEMLWMLKKLAEKGVLDSRLAKVLTDEEYNSFYLATDRQIVRRLKEDEVPYFFKMPKFIGSIIAYFFSKTALDEDATAELISLLREMEPRFHA